MPVYFAQPIEGGAIKIGFSDNVKSRVRQLKWEYGRKLALLRVLDGNRETEQAIHEQFSSYRLDRREWFRPVTEILDFIGRPLLVDPNPETVEAMSPRTTIPRTRGVTTEGNGLGPILAANLIRLGYSETTVQAKEIARLVREKTGKSMSRQRISAILNAVRVTPGTIETIAKAIGVNPGDLTRPPR